MYCDGQSHVWVYGCLFLLQIDILFYCCHRTIFAFDLDVNRLDTMRTLLDKAGVTCAVLKHQDFLTVSATRNILNLIVCCGLLI